MGAQRLELAEEIAALPGAALRATCAAAIRSGWVPKALETRTQYDFVALSGGVVNDALFVPTGVVVVPLAPSYH